MYYAILQCNIMCYNMLAWGGSEGGGPPRVRRIGRRGGEAAEGPPGGCQIARARQGLPGLAL